MPLLKESKIKVKPILIPFSLVSDPVFVAVEVLLVVLCCVVLCCVVFLVCVVLFDG